MATRPAGLAHFAGRYSRYCHWRSDDWREQFTELPQTTGHVETGRQLRQCILAETDSENLVRQRQKICGLRHGHVFGE